MSRRGMSVPRRREFSRLTAGCPATRPALRLLRWHPVPRREPGPGGSVPPGPDSAPRHRMVSRGAVRQPGKVAPQVAGPTMPSTSRPFFDWKSRHAAYELGP